MTKIPTISDFVYFVFVLEETLENIKVVYDQGPRGTTSLAAASWHNRHNRRNRHLPNARVIQVTFALSHFRTFALSDIACIVRIVRIVRHLYRLVCTVSECLTTSEHFQLHRGAGTKFDISIWFYYIHLYSTCAWFVCYSSHQDRPAAKCHIHILCISMCLRSVGFFPSSMLFVSVCICQREQNPLSVILPITFSCWVLKFIEIEEVWDSGTKCRPICVWVCLNSWSQVQMTKKKVMESGGFICRRNQAILQDVIGRINKFDHQGSSYCNFHLEISFSFQPSSDLCFSSSVLIFSWSLAFDLSITKASR